MDSVILSWGAGKAASEEKGWQDIGPQLSLSTPEEQMDFWMVLGPRVPEALPALQRED